MLSLTILNEGVSDVEDVGAIVEPYNWKFGYSNFLEVFNSSWSSWFFSPGLEWPFGDFECLHIDSFVT